MSTTPFLRLLDERFAALGIPAETNRKRADALGIDPATFSKILNGSMSLSEERAQIWSERLFPDDADARPEFAKRLLLLGQAAARPLTVPELCDKIVAEGGVVPAERISDLFEALTQAHDPLVLIEYRDVPRAGPQAKYQDLGRALGKAIADGISVAMLMPFRPEATSNEDEGEAAGASRASRYSLDVRDGCRRAYVAFRRFAVEELGETRKLEADERLRLYEAASDVSSVGCTGIQAKMFYVQYNTGGPGGILLRHHRIFQWVATPTRDWLLYRGEAHIDPEALRDSFFPIPHVFDLLGAERPMDRLPNLPDPTDKVAWQAWSAIEAKLAEQWFGYGLPFGKALWKSYARPA
jgi:hypothetical protein